VVSSGSTPETTYYVYDSTGQRVRKVTERQSMAGQKPTRKQERIYLRGFEIYREYAGDSAAVTLERETLHVMDDHRGVAIVETKTRNQGTPVVSPTPQIRYQLDNYLGSACVELDGKAAVITYEEYYPYGSTSYQAVRNQVEVSAKRYRYTSKERDEENGLYYHGARYYVSWLGRWVSCDPSEVDPANLYQAYRGSPTRYADPDGRAEVDKANEPAIRWASAGKGWLRYGGLAVDEPKAVGESGISTAERMDRAKDILRNRQLLDRMTNSATKRDFKERPIMPREQLPLVSVVDQPSAVWRPTLENVQEWRELSKILSEKLEPRLQKMTSPGKVKEAINESIRNELKNPTTDPGRKLNDALRAQTGVDPKDLFRPTTSFKRLWATPAGRQALANAGVIVAGAIVAYAESASAEQAQKEANEELMRQGRSLDYYATDNPDMGTLVIQVFEVRRIVPEAAAITTFRYQALSHGRSEHEAWWKYLDTPKLDRAVDVFSREEVKLLWIPPLNERGMIPVEQNR
jgi:RHS repeat-associated protein